MVEKSALGQTIVCDRNLLSRFETLSHCRAPSRVPRPMPRVIDIAKGAVRLQT